MYTFWFPRGTQTWDRINIRCQGSQANHLSHVWGKLHHNKLQMKQSTSSLKLDLSVEEDSMDGDFQVDLMDPCPGSQGQFVTETMTLPKARVGASTNDQRYLLVFILGTYFGPDIRDDVPRKSSLQRLAMRMPLYSSDELGGSVFKLSEIESIYYYALRNSHPSARVKLQSLYKFLQGHLAPPVKETLEDDRQFTSFFQPHLHRQSRYKGTYKVVENIVFINDPDLSFFKVEDMERFKRLSGLNDLVLDRDAARSFPHGQRTDRDEERQARFHAMAKAHGHVQESRPMSLMLSGVGHELRKKKKRKENLEMITLPTIALSKEEKSHCSSSSCKMTAAAMLLLPSLPTVDQWNNIVNAAKPSIVFTGTAAARQAGPLIGLVDIGVCEDAYLFRAALPGVRKDEGDFNCQVEVDGKVTIKGTTTTGETRIFKNSRVFNMQSQHLCPPGAFSISFKLPGPVEPNEFIGNFGSDGILEGMVMKQRVRSGSACLTFES